jgi:hypothetical protein
MSSRCNRGLVVPSSLLSFRLRSEILIHDKKPTCRFDGSSVARSLTAGNFFLRLSDVSYDAGPHRSVAAPSARRLASPRFVCFALRSSSSPRACPDRLASSSFASLTRTHLTILIRRQRPTQPSRKRTLPDAPLPTQHQHLPLYTLHALSDNR